MTELPARFAQLIGTITGAIGDATLDEALATKLAREFPPEGPLFRELEALCRQGCADGWLCAREHGGIRFGRVIKPTDASHGFSVDVVDMNDVVGPHHSHPNGEIDMVMPLDDAALFDRSARGWKVYGPGSAHHPTVEGGRALVLYLLPQGAIEFTAV